ncbi:class I SAM-dependent methyltransferase [Paenibacillus alginolyticus]|uniref:Class I SAM-dependent methyltransferase n=1 Tax=Paenibacillus alginolyticus TaxID=59839 RepID=A0ABT4GFP6_9BACL|nr:class I SAM-dependent methyltransferase [Paenibacillus alginolyticus]MCY9695022.1 class I SAM-dependent methyltransferase [Paenibacillus alginolyticus]MEC0145434.1 class I SAM-dependent methyltransferase [Paenibacillus alginolyticus]
MLVTTSYNPSSDLLDKAVRLAAEYDGRVVPRRKYSLEHLRNNYKDDTLLLVTRDEIRYYGEDQPAYFFHPSMALVRVKRMQRGEADLLIEASGAAFGDNIVDCTAGLASDSIVFSFAVGPQGSVTALESEKIPAMLIQEGLAVYVSEIPELNEAMRRITVRKTHHLAYLQQLAPQSVDVVYFDPMFRSPIEESQAISHLRRNANDEAVSMASIEEAKRVARKSIVLKENRDSKEFARLGFEHVLRSTTKTTYGVIRLC